MALKTSGSQGPWIGFSRLLRCPRGSAKPYDVTPGASYSDLGIPPSRAWEEGPGHFLLLLCLCPVTQCAPCPEMVTCKWPSGGPKECMRFLHGRTLGSTEHQITSAVGAPGPACALESPEAGGKCQQQSLPLGGGLWYPRPLVLPKRSR